MTIPAAEPPVPPALVDPSGVWFFNWVIPLLGGLVIVLAIADTIRRRRLTWGLLFIVNSMLVYWMETIGDWGQQLVYSPAFTEHHLLDWLPIKTPNDPLFMPFAYACYWAVHAFIVLRIGQFLVRRFDWSLLRAVAVLAIPVNYAWDFLVESLAAAMGWWVYDPGFGPHVEFGNGGKFTVLWTIGLMSFWPNLIAYWAGKPPVRMLNHFERFFGLERFTVPRPGASGASDASDAPRSEPGTSPVPGGSTGTAVIVRPPRQRADRQQPDRRAEYDDRLDYEVTIPRWKFELARFGAWFVVFQVTFFVMLVIPLVAMRALTGHDSVYVP
ncbi:hypothetical protein [Frankia gtarii]|uniref:hypothetical protein n=1 Tax=Frankia gtarii TaxID=2950102 RepID=UPI0021BE240C|nr:hypothetical protein [Frankia gtarii]